MVQQTSIDSHISTYTAKTNYSELYAFMLKDSEHKIGQSKWVSQITIDSSYPGDNIVQYWRIKAWLVGIILSLQGHFNTAMRGNTVIHGPAVKAIN